MGPTPNLSPHPPLLGITVVSGNAKPYLEGQGDLVNGLIMGITRVTIWAIGVINLLTKSPRPSK